MTAGQALWSADVVTTPSNEVFVLGAGFSKAISDEMPVLTELAECVPGSPPGLDLAPNLRPQEFESWLSYLSTDQPWLTEAENYRNRALFLDVARRISEFLIAKEDVVLAAAVPPWLLHLVQYWHKTRATVITFNYDVLVEKAFTAAVQVEATAGDGNNYVSATQLLPLPLTPLGSRHGAVLSAGPTDTFSLLKLHGSTSWAYSGAASYFGEAIYDLGVRAQWTPERPKGMYPDKVPLIIPPTSGKSAFFNNEFVRQQWRLAYNALLGANAVYAVGYSMPATDEMTRFLFAATLRPGSRLWVVNRDQAVVGRMQQVARGVGSRAAIIEDSAVKRLVELLTGVDVGVVPDGLVTTLERL